MVFYDNRQVIKTRYTSSLSMSDLAQLLIGLWAYPSLFNKAKQIKIEFLFNSTENLFKFIWSVMKHCQENNVNLYLWPEIIENKLTEIVFRKNSEIFIKLVQSKNDKNEQINEDDFSSELISSDDLINKIIWFIYGSSCPLSFWKAWQAKKQESGEDLLSSDYIAKLFKLFVVERIQPELLNKLSLPDPSLVLENLDEIFKEFNEKVSIQNTEIIKPASNIGWTPNKRKIIKSNISFLDELTVGGLAEREVGGILGFINSGKTTLAVQMLLNYGISEYLKAQSDALYIPKHWYLFSYEIETERLKEIIHSQLAVIPLSKLRNISSINDLSTKFGSEVYENKNYFLFDFIGRLSEKERFTKAVEILSELPIHFVDVLALERDKIEIDFIAEIIQNEFLQNKQIGGIIIDYAGAMVRMTSAVSDSFQFRQLLGSCPIYFKQKIAKPFNCIVWIFHQYSAETNKLKIKSPDHTNSAEARNFGENLDCCLCMSPVKTLFFPQYLDIPSGQFLRISCSKLRYAPKPDEQKIIHFNTSSSQFIDVSNLLGYDNKTDLYYPKTK